MNKDELMTVSTAAKITGITIRTLHHYDKIGLLSPASISQSKYRLYSYKDLEQLQQILFFKEIGFSLKNIKQIMSAPHYSKKEALQKHIQVLAQKKQRLDSLIELIENVLNKEGESNEEGKSMADFTFFKEDNLAERQREYYQEASRRWGNTRAFQEYTNKNNDIKSNEDWQLLNNAVQDFFKEIFKHIDESPDNNEVQSIIHEWKAFISANFYECSVEMLRHLGLIYISDERFSKYINNCGDNRLSGFVTQAINSYCDYNGRSQSES